MTDEEFIATETDVAPDRKGLVLKNRTDDSCAWLTEDNRCRIHPVKPDKCRTFPYEWTNSDSYEICAGLKGLNRLCRGESKSGQLWRAKAERLSGKGEVRFMPYL
jgi:Fe-S-cluster containining protein